MATRGLKHAVTDPYECARCGAMVFVSPKLHSFICSQYKEAQTLIAGSHKYYELYKEEQAEAERKKAQEALEKAAKKPRKSRRKKKNEEDNGVQAEESGEGGNASSGWF